VVWLGRVDYGVSIHEARTGELDVQFAASNILGVNDMLLSSSTAGKPASMSTEAAASPFSQHARTSSAASFHPLAAALSSSLASVMATPNGKVALRDPVGQISWVSDATFRSPVAFAVDSTTGSSLPVDILADAAVPNGSTEYVSKEMERQMMNLAQPQQPEEIQGRRDREDSGEHRESESDDSEEEDEQTIIGFLSTGDLFAMPLGRRHGSAKFSSLSASASTASPSFYHHSHHTTASSSSAATGAASSAFHAVKVPGLSRHAGLHHSHQLPPGESSKMHHPKKPLSCRPGNPLFPACLVADGRSHYVPSYYFAESSVDDGTRDPNLAALAVKYQDDPLDGWYVPPHHYTIVKPSDKRQRRYQKLLRVMGSWLPPTIAMLFVVSFELGRRKRQGRQASHISQSSHASGLSLETTTAVVSPHDEAAKTDSVRLIQVMDDVILGYGGHGTVVYKGLLDGRQVAVKRMLRAYHASADREISLLIESDGHPNVVRYFLKEVRGDFVYLALELCDLSLHDLILKLKSRWGQREKEHVSPLSPVSFAAKNVLYQIANGVKHLHTLRIVHRFVTSQVRFLLTRHHALIV
jgi:hypothetical protein